jgi:hypothetical protein
MEIFGMSKNTQSIIIFLFSLFLNLLGQPNNAISNGVFEANTDIGDVGIKGSLDYNAEDDSYVIMGAGENMWFEKDAFHFVWKKVSGDISISSQIDWISEGVNPHRKAGVIIRQNLTPGSPYIDAIIHGDGLTSLQYREIENKDTHEIQSYVSTPSRGKF